jgi:hypothetical protein
MALEALSSANGLRMIVGLLCLAAVLFVAAGLIWWGSFYKSSVHLGNDADKLVAQFNSDWPTFVGKPEGSSIMTDGWYDVRADPRNTGRNPYLKNIRASRGFYEQ